MRQSELDKFCQANAGLSYMVKGQNYFFLDSISRMEKVIDRSDLKDMNVYDLHLAIYKSGCLE